MLLKILLIIAIVIVAFIAITFIVYWFNLDMKFVRYIYDKLQPHYDNLKKDKKL